VPKSLLTTNQFNFWEAAMLETGQQAPAFTLPDQNDNAVSLKDFSGKWMVLYFYPKDNTSG